MPISDLSQWLPVVVEVALVAVPPCIRFARSLVRRRKNRKRNGTTNDGAS